MFKRLFEQFMVRLHVATSMKMKGKKEVYKTKQIKLSLYSYDSHKVWV